MDYNFNTDNLNTGYNPNTPFNTDFSTGYNTNTGFNTDFGTDYNTNTGYNPDFNTGYDTGYNTGFTPVYNTENNYSDYRAKKRKRLALLIAIIAAVVIVIVAAVFAARGIFANHGQDDPFTNSVYSEHGNTSNESEQTANARLGSDYYYKKLDPLQQKVYNLALEAMNNATYRIDLSDEQCTTEEFNLAMDAMWNDHCELFWMSKCTIYSDEDNYVQSAEWARMGYWDEDTAYDTYYKPTMDAIDRIVQEAEQYDSDYEKALFVHDYLVANTDYDEERYAEAKKESHSPESELIFTPYGCLVEHNCVCDGYAKAYMLIMNKLGVDCIYVWGEAGEAHAWNRITIDGEEYFVDVTWDDPLSFDDEESDFISHDYFLINTQELEKTHEISDRFEIETTTATKYNYYVYNGCFAGDYDFDTVNEIISNQADNDAIFIKFSDIDELEKASDDLFENERIWNCDAVNGHYDAYTFTTNENIYLLTIFLG